MTYEPQEPHEQEEQHPAEFASVTFAEEPQPPRPSTGRRAWLFLVAGLVILLDQLTKAYIENWLPLGTSWTPFPEWSHLFQLTHTTNTGAAFGVFPDGGTVFAVIAVIVSAVIIFYNHQLPAGNLLLRTALALQMGGALGNMIDRLRQGHVTDFLDFGPVPVFNLADTSIVTGVIFLAFLMLDESRQHHTQTEPPVTEETDEEHQARDRRTISRLPAQSPDEWTTG